MLGTLFHLKRNGHRGHKYNVTKAHVIIGTSLSADVRIVNPEASEGEPICLINTEEGRHATLKNLGRNTIVSLNGSSIGSALKVLKDNDKIRIHDQEFLWSYSHSFVTEKTEESSKMKRFSEPLRQVAVVSPRKREPQPLENETGRRKTLAGALFKEEVSFMKKTPTPRGKARKERFSVKGTPNRANLSFHNEPFTNLESVTFTKKDDVMSCFNTSTPREMGTPKSIVASARKSHAVPEIRVGPATPKSAKRKLAKMMEQLKTHRTPPSVSKKSKKISFTSSKRALLTPTFAKTQKISSTKKSRSAESTPQNFSSKKAVNSPKALKRSPKTPTRVPYEKSPKTPKVLSNKKTPKPLSNKKSPKTPEVPSNKKSPKTPEVPSNKKTPKALSNKKSPKTPEVPSIKKTPKTLSNKKSPKTPEVLSNKKRPKALSNKKSPKTPEVLSNKKTPKTLSNLKFPKKPEVLSNKKTPKALSNKKSPKALETPPGKKFLLTPKISSAKRSPKTLSLKKFPWTPKTLSSLKSPMTPKILSAKKSARTPNLLPMKNFPKTLTLGGSSRKKSKTPVRTKTLKIISPSSPDKKKIAALLNVHKRPLYSSILKKGLVTPKRKGGLSEDQTQVDSLRAQLKIRMKKVMKQPIVARMGASTKLLEPAKISSSPVKGGGDPGHEERQEPIDILTALDLGRKDVVLRQITDQRISRRLRKHSVRVVYSEKKARRSSLKEERNQKATAVRFFEEASGLIVPVKAILKRNGEPTFIGSPLKTPRSNKKVSFSPLPRSRLQSTPINPEQMAGHRVSLKAVSPINSTLELSQYQTPSVSQDVFISSLEGSSRSGRSLRLEFSPVSNELGSFKDSGVEASSSSPRMRTPESSAKRSHQQSEDVLETPRTSGKKKRKVSLAKSLVSEETGKASRLLQSLSIDMNFDVSLPGRRSTKESDLASIIKKKVEELTSPSKPSDKSVKSPRNSQSNSQSTLQRKILKELEIDMNFEPEPTRRSKEQSINRTSKSSLSQEPQSASPQKSLVVGVNSATSRSKQASSGEDSKRQSNKKPPLNLTTDPLTKSSNKKKGISPKSGSSSTSSTPSKESARKSLKFADNSSLQNPTLGLSRLSRQLEIDMNFDAVPAKRVKGSRKSDLNISGVSELASIKPTPVQLSGSKKRKSGWSPIYPPILKTPESPKKPKEKNHKARSERSTPTSVFHVFSSTNLSPNNDHHLTGIKRLFSEKKLNKEDVKRLFEDPTPAVRDPSPATHKPPGRRGLELNPKSKRKRVATNDSPNTKKRGRSPKHLEEPASEKRSLRRKRGAESPKGPELQVEAQAKRARRKIEEPSKPATQVSSPGAKPRRRKNAADSNVEGSGLGKEEAAPAVGRRTRQTEVSSPSGAKPRRRKNAADSNAEGSGPGKEEAAPAVGRRTQQTEVSQTEAKPRRRKNAADSNAEGSGLGKEEAAPTVERMTRQTEVSSPSGAKPRRRKNAADSNAKGSGPGKEEAAPAVGRRTRQTEVSSPTEAKPRRRKNATNSNVEGSGLERRTRKMEEQPLQELSPTRTGPPRRKNAADSNVEGSAPGKEETKVDGRMTAKPRRRKNAAGSNVEGSGTGKEETTLVEGRRTRKMEEQPPQKLSPPKVRFLRGKNANSIMEDSKLNQTPPIKGRTRGQKAKKEPEPIEEEKDQSEAKAQRGRRPRKGKPVEDEAASVSQPAPSKSKKPAERSPSDPEEKESEKPKRGQPRSAKGGKSSGQTLAVPEGRAMRSAAPAKPERSPQKSPRGKRGRKKIASDELLKSSPPASSLPTETLSSPVATRSLRSKGAKTKPVESPKRNVRGRKRNQ